VTVIVPLPEMKGTAAVPRSPPVPLKFHVMALAFEVRTRRAATNPTAMPICLHFMMNLQSFVFSY
jgi:hypothetical protein